MKAAQRSAQLCRDISGWTRQFVKTRGATPTGATGVVHLRPEIRTRWSIDHAPAARSGAAFGGIISEVGAGMLVGGNIAGQTRVLTTAIVLETRPGDFSPAPALGVILLTIALVVNVALMKLQSRT